MIYIVLYLCINTTQIQHVKTNYKILLSSNLYLNFHLKQICITLFSFYNTTADSPFTQIRGGLRGGLEFKYVVGMFNRVRQMPWAAPLVYNFQ